MQFELQRDKPCEADRATRCKRQKARGKRYIRGKRADQIYAEADYCFFTMGDQRQEARDKPSEALDG